ncbi:hypothetical protein GCM10009865_53220 [Aeromicrobium ponti]
MDRPNWRHDGKTDKNVYEGFCPREENGFKIKFKPKKKAADRSAAYLLFTPGLSSYPAVKIAAKKVTITPIIIIVPIYM